MFFHSLRELALCTISWQNIFLVEVCNKCCAIGQNSLTCSSGKEGEGRRSHISSIGPLRSSWPSSHLYDCSRKTYKERNHGRRLLNVCAQRRQCGDTGGPEVGSPQLGSSRTHWLCLSSGVTHSFMQPSWTPQRPQPM